MPRSVMRLARCAARRAVRAAGRVSARWRDCARSGRRLAKSSSAGDAAGHHQHDDQQQHRVEERRPRDQGCGELRQDRQDDGAEQRPEDRAAPADQDRDEEQHRQIEGEGVGRDVGSAASRTARPRCRPRAGEQEDRDQQLRLRNSGRLRGHFGVADRDQRRGRTGWRRCWRSSRCRSPRARCRR